MLLWILLPNSNLNSAKTRPALIVQADNLQTGLPQIIVAMITSQMVRAGHPSRVTILLNSLEEQQSGFSMFFGLILAPQLAVKFRKHDPV